MTIYKRLPSHDHHGDRALSYVPVGRTAASGDECQGDRAEGWAVAYLPAEDIEPCSAEGDNHSGDRVTVYQGKPEPSIMCGYHASRL